MCMCGYVSGFIIQSYFSYIEKHVSLNLRYFTVVLFSLLDHI